MATDYRGEIEKMEALLAASGGGKAAEAKGAADKPAAAEPQRIDKAAEAEDAASSAGSLMSEMQVAPAYFKPAFLLPTMTPMVRATMFLKQGGKTVTWDLLDDGAAAAAGVARPTHNHVRRFTYAPFGDAGEGLKATMEIVDVDASMAEALMLRFGALMQAGREIGLDENSVITMEIKYGWYVPESLAQQYSARFGDSATVSFTQTILCFVTFPRLKYNMDGTISCTMEMTADDSAQPPMMWWKPIESLGAFPAMNIVLAQFLETVMNMYASARGATTAKRTERFVKSVASWMFVEFLDCTPEQTQRAQFRETLRRTVDLFHPEMRAEVETWVNDAFLNGVTNKLSADYANKPPKSSGTAAAESASKRIEKALASVGADVSSIVSAGDALARAVGGGGFSRTSVEGAAGAGLTGIRQIKQVPANWSTIANGSPASVIAGMFKGAASGPAQSGFSEVFSDAIRKIRRDALDSSSADFRNAMTLMRFIENVTSILKESYVHPLVVETYVLERLFAKVKDANAPVDAKTGAKLVDGKDGETEVSIMYVSMFDRSKVEPTNGTLDGSYYGAAVLGGKNVFMTRAQKHRWMIRAGEITAGPTTSWTSLVQDAAQRVRVNFSTGNRADAEMLAGGADGPKVEERAGMYYVPISAKTIAFVTGNEGAAENIAKMIGMLKRKFEGGSGSAEEAAVTKFLQDKYQMARAAVGGAMKKWIFVIDDVVPSDAPFYPGITTSQIKQAFSFRFYGGTDAGGAATQWNPGWPAAWDVNFPDVLSFEPEMDFQAAITGIVQNSKPMGMNEGMAVVEDEMTKKCADAWYAVKVAADPSKKAANKADVAEARRAIAELKEALAKDETGASWSRKMSDRHPITFNLDFGARRVGGGNVPEAIAGKRSLQEFRKRMLMESVNASATLRVFGDPSFVQSDSGKFLLVKVTNPDGTLSVFTGLYRMKSLTHEISAGRFESTFGLMRDGTAGNTDAARAMEAAVYDVDHMVLSRR